jgi:hypothetical protein
MIPLGFATTAAMVRRGFDLSGDQKIDPHPPAGSVSLDAYFASVFNFGDLLMFSILAIGAICYRRRPEIHKRMMLFANIALMGAPIVSVIRLSLLLCSSRRSLQFQSRCYCWPVLREITW